MAQDFEQLLKEVFGDSIGRLSQFQSDQMQRFMSRAQDIAREALKDDLTRINTELGELRARLTVLEEERAQAAADSLDNSF
jgi:uncharacterized protein YPO0396